MVISRYQKRLSGPLLDRTLAPHARCRHPRRGAACPVPEALVDHIDNERRGESPAAIRARVEAARARQAARFAAGVGGGRGGVTPPLQLTTNADMGPTQVRDHCPVDETGRQLLGAAMLRLPAGR